MGVVNLFLLQLLRRETKKKAPWETRFESQSGGQE
jgi:hypothetical protein